MSYPIWQGREGGGGILKSVCLEVRSVHSFPQKDYIGETKMHINKLCTKSAWGKCLR